MDSPLILLFAQKGKRLPNLRRLIQAHKLFLMGVVFVHIGRVGSTYFG